MSDGAGQSVASRAPAGGAVLLKVVVFGLALALLFTLVANTLPQVEGEAPAEESVDLAALDLDAFVALGERLFHGKGACTLCHNDLGRAPDLLALDVARTAEERLADARYRGGAADAEGYLRESLLDPSAYVVPGYGQKGTNDTVSPMPAADRPPITLSRAEIDAVIAFLQAKDGNEVTVALPAPGSAPATARAPAGSDPPAPAAPAAATAPASTPEEVIAKFACAACHTLLGTQSPVGPSLDDVGARLDREAIRQSILDPGAVIAEGFPPGLMPADVADRMTARELEMLVQWLSERR